MNIIGSEYLEIVHKGNDKVICKGFRNGMSCSEVVIPDGVTEIADYAFGSNNDDIVRVYCPDSVARIGKNAFQSCESLEEIRLPQRMNGVWGSIVDGCYKLRRVVIPYGITEIGEDAFNDDNSLTEIVIPDTITKIDKGAFRYCESLEKLIIPDKITKICERTFECCRALKELYIPDNVTEVNMKDTFSVCNSLTSIHFPENIVFSSLSDEDGDLMFVYCNALKTVQFGTQTFEFEPNRFHKIWHYWLDNKKPYTDEEMKAIIAYCCVKEDTERMLKLFNLDRDTLKMLPAREDPRFI